MMHLGDTPHLETASPFATPPTVIESALSDIQKAILTGIGVAVGAGIVLLLFPALVKGK
jgi:hypothetical protein